MDNVAVDHSTPWLDASYNSITTISERKAGRHDEVLKYGHILHRWYGLLLDDVKPFVYEALNRMDSGQDARTISRLAAPLLTLTKGDQVFYASSFELVQDLSDYGHKGFLRGLLKDPGREPYMAAIPVTDGNQGSPAWSIVTVRTALNVQQAAEQDAYQKKDAWAGEW